MRKIEIIIPIDKIAEVTGLLNKLFYDYTVIEGKTEALLIIFTETGSSKIAIDELKRIGISTSYGRINIIPILGLIPRPSKRADKENKVQSISFEELFQLIEPATHSDFIYITFCIISSIIAALGLIYDNAAVIIGSMLLSPLMGPIIGTSFGTIINDRRMLKRSLLTETTGIILSISIGLILGFSSNIPSPEMIARTNPTLADFGLAIASGIAAGLCFITELSTALVGVAVAASLMPPITNVGLLLTMGHPEYALSSLILFLINFLCINFTCTITFFIAGIKSPVQSKRMEKLTARIFRKHLLIMFFAIILLVLVIVLAVI
jgi:uncharacterized hydrophobic protein (TIGR00271 family)